MRCSYAWQKVLKQHTVLGNNTCWLHTCCPQFCDNQTHHTCRSHHLYSRDPAEHLCFANPCNFRTLDRFKCSWLATAADILEWTSSWCDFTGRGFWQAYYIERSAALYMHLTCTAVLEVYYSKIQALLLNKFFVQIIFVRNWLFENILQMKINQKMVATYNLATRNIFNWSTFW